MFLTKKCTCEHPKKKEKKCNLSKKEKAVASQKSKADKGEKPRPGDEELPIQVGEVADKRSVRRKMRLLT